MPICSEAGEGVARAGGILPERHARISGEHWTGKDCPTPFQGKERRSPFLLTPGVDTGRKMRVIRDCQRFNLEARKDHLNGKNRCSSMDKETREYNGSVPKMPGPLRVKLFPHLDSD
jgi:hypothetical protein